MIFQDVHEYKPLPSSNDDLSSPFKPNMHDNSIFALPRKAAQNCALLFKLRDDTVTIEGEKPNEDQQIRHGIRKPTNPFRLLSRLELSHWLVLLSGCLALFSDFLDFGVLAVGMEKIAAYYDTTKARISDSITYTMVMRIVGAIIFGILGDLYGRRLPLVINLIMLGALQIGSIYCTSVNVFIGMRGLFGIAMGGIYSNAASTLMDEIEPELRGLCGAIFQASASCSGFVAAGLNMAFGARPESWKSMFWVSAGVSLFAAFIRFLVPDSKQFREAMKKVKEREHSEEYSANIPHKPKAKAEVVKFFKELAAMFILHWQTFIYCAVFLALISWASHSIDDNMVNFYRSGKGIDNRDASEIAMITKSGSVIGQIVIGWLGEFVGRRRVALIGTIFAAALLPAALVPSSFTGLCVGGFFFEFFLHSYACIIAAHFNELAPKAFRSILPGVSYQLGTTISAPAAMIVNILAERRKVNLNGKQVEAYQPVLLIIGEICLFLMILLAIFGPERRGADLNDFKPAELESLSDISSMREEEEDWGDLTGDPDELPLRSIPSQHQ